MEIKRPEKFGGDMTLESYSELEKLYQEGKIHPADLKNSVTYYLNEMVGSTGARSSRGTRVGHLGRIVWIFASRTRPTCVVPRSASMPI